MSSALPGVGIAVALVPPLATVGICVQLGLGSLAHGALLLFLTNLAAIVLSGAVMIAAAGFRPKREGRTGRATGIGFAAAVALVIVVAVPLAIHTRGAIADTRANQTVNDQIAEWDPLVRVVSLAVDDVGPSVEVELVVTSPRRSGQCLGARSAACATTSASP